MTTQTSYGYARSIPDIFVFAFAFAFTSSILVDRFWANAVGFLITGLGFLILVGISILIANQ